MDAVDDRDRTSPVVQMEVDQSGIAWLSIGDGSDRAVALSTLRALERTIDALEVLIDASEVAAVILVVETARHRLDSYPVDEVARMTEDEVASWSREAQRILGRLERLSAPTVAAIEGTWLGSAAEMALACSYRVAANRPDAGIGFPHVSSDLLPAWGGTVRIPRLTDMEGTLRILLRGETLDPAAARGLGVIDRIIPAAGFRARVATYALRKTRRERRIALSDRPINRGLLEGSRGGRRLILSRAARRYLGDPESARAGSATRVTFELLARSESLSSERAFALEAGAAARENIGSSYAGER